jgi:hypothetical protein
MFGFIPDKTNKRGIRTLAFVPCGATNISLGRREGKREREREIEREREMTEKTITPSPTNPNAWSISIDIRCKHKIIAIYIRCKPMSDLVGVGWGVTLASSFTGGRKGKM